MKRHLLYEVNLDRKTAFCTKCGYTEIRVSQARTGTTKIFCINSAREIWLDRKAYEQQKREERRKKLGWKPKHILSEIDPETLRATCAICGPTDIRKYTSKGYSGYECLTNVRQYLREYKRARYVPRSTNPHALTQINEGQKTAVCAMCGPVQIEVRFGKKKILRRCINAKTQWDKATTI